MLKPSSLTWCHNGNVEKRNVEILLDTSCICFDLFCLGCWMSVDVGRYCMILHDLATPKISSASLHKAICRHMQAIRPNYLKLFTISFKYCEAIAVEISGSILKARPCVRTHGKAKQSSMHQAISHRKLGLRRIHQHSGQPQAKCNPNAASLHLRSLEAAAFLCNSNNDRQILQAAWKENTALWAWRKVQSW